MKDVLGNDIVPGDRIGCAFSYSQASVGTIRLGKVVEIDDTGVDRWGQPHTKVKCVWDRSPDKVSPWMEYGANHRWVKI
jgi:hypothetical protein